MGSSGTAALCGLDWHRHGVFFVLALPCFLGRCNLYAFAISLDQMFRTGLRDVFIVLISGVKVMSLCFELLTKQNFQLRQISSCLGSLNASLLAFN